MAREEGTCNKDEYGQTAGAGHERNDGNCDKPALAALYHAGCHDGRNVATESHHHGYETLAMQAQMVHQLVHYESSARHVAGILQQRNKEIEYQYVRQEDQHASNTGNDAIDNEVLEPAIGH